MVKRIGLIVLLAVVVYLGIRADWMMFAISLAVCTAVWAVPLFLKRKA